METTDHDYADKNWLREPQDDGFQILSPDLAIVLFVVCGFLGYLLGRFA